MTERSAYPRRNLAATHYRFGWESSESTLLAQNFGGHLRYFSRTASARTLSSLPRSASTMNT